jgi:hypothetical protein
VDYVKVDNMMEHGYQKGEIEMLHRAIEQCGRPHGPDPLAQLTWPEHYTLMTLWCISRSPLMWGGDPLTSPEQSIAFLKNKEVIEVNQKRTRNRQVFRRGDQVVWMADIPGSEDWYLALFNLADQPKPITFDFELENLRGRYGVRDLWMYRNLCMHTKEFSATLDPHGAGLYKLTRKD